MYWAGVGRMEHQVTDPGRVRRWALPLLLLAGLFLRLWQINGAFWYDEAFSARLAKMPPENILTATFFDVHPPAYYLLLWFVGQWAGYSEWVLRLPSVAVGVLLIWLVYRLGLSLGLAPPVVLLAAALTALAPFQVYYGAEARFYALLMVSITVGALGLTTGRRTLVVAGFLAALYLHNISLVFVTSLVAIWFAAGLLGVGGNGLGLPPTPLKQKLVTMGIITGGSLPALVWNSLQALSITNNYWIPPLHNPGRVLAMLDDLLYLMPGHPFVIPTALVTLVGLLIIGIAWRRIIQTPPALFLLVAGGLPLVLLTVLSVVWQPVLISRVVAPVAPFYYLLLAWAVLQTRRRTTLWAVVTLPTLTAILAGMLLGKFGHRPVNTDYLSMYHNYRPGDAIYHANPGSYLTFAYYRPDIPQYMWTQGTSDLSQMLTRQTRHAMAFREIDFDLIKCAVWADGVGNTNKIDRWWIVKFDGPGTSQAEKAAISGIIAGNTLLNEITVQHDTMVDARLYLITPNCERSQPYGKTEKSNINFQPRQTPIQPIQQGIKQTWSQ